MSEIIIGGVYEHFKGKRYKVIALARDSDNCEEVVVYQGLYASEEFGDDPVWTRSKKEFLETIERDGKRVERFRLV